MMLPICITGHAVDRLRERFPLGTEEDWNQSKERLRGLHMHSEPFGVQLGVDQIRASGEVFIATTMDAGMVVIKTVLTRDQAIRSSAITAQLNRVPKSKRQKARQRHARDERSGSGQGVGEVRVPLRRSKRRRAA